ncbi:MAG TPA: valine--tRNA ligase [Thiotrichaceae bacterium]|jgi:valyl-tRNA synthetase|nr:valine--tRNA ligase [Thiotrichaceae bacterium]HIM08102.1 valine--tRNA ligase [Gammaproteobacteria bacterium]
MEKTYKPESIETNCYNNWEKNNYFAPQNNGENQGNSYCIMLPPPNVTGSLHMGHAFQQTLMDVLTRYHRMNDHDTLWQCGTDHAGIATQMVVERQLQQKDISRHDLGREKFIDEIWNWKEHSGNTITRQSRRLGTSMDWSRERFTMDEGLSDAVKEVFVRLHDEGLIYRGKRLVNWDPVLHTAISDLEVISEEENGHLWHMRYPLKEPVDGLEYIVVATTRPETMLGDAAVAVHPDDERYKNLIDKEVLLPLTDRSLPVIADDYVDPDFGTGCVKITPAHDFNDYEMGQRHNLEKINIFTIDAALNEDVPEKYRGLDRYVARKQILADLEELGLIEKIDDHKLMVPRGDRSHAVVEPYLTDQWYVKIQPLADPAIKAVKDGDIKFVPGNWDKTYFEWMNNIEDWCISRQLWWGHRIPAWYDDEGNIYVGRDEAEARSKNNLDDDINLKQDEDVLDTWFSSALWPYSTLGWPEKTPELDKFYPTNVLVTGFDIIFFWVARMIMMGLKFMGDVPFKEIYIHGLVRDSDGQKMSKSKGNVIDPLDVIDGIDLEALVTKRTTGLMQPKMAAKIEKSTRKHFPDGIPAYGTDALRFTFATMATQGRDIRFDIARIEGYRNFCNKIWNATRYVMMNVESQSIDFNNGDKKFGLAERWINTKLSEVIATTHEGIRTYRFDLASQALYEFTWDQYCDWYLELSKTTLNSDETSEAEKRGTLFTLLNVLETLLRTLHPFMPFITEELWHRVAPLIEKEGESIMLESFPKQDDLESDADSAEQIEWIKLFILGVRRIRAERDISPGKSLNVFVRNGTEKELKCLSENQSYIKSLGKIGSISNTEGEMDDAVMALAGEMTLLVPLADIIDPEAEKARIVNIIEKLAKEKSGIENKLENKNFVERAPADVVEGVKQRLADILNEIKTYQVQLVSISKLLDK